MNVGKVGRWVLYGLTLPWTLTVGYGWVILMCLILAAEWESLRFQGTAVLTTQWRKWASKRWNYSTTLGRGVIYHPDHVDDDSAIDTRLERHEHVHVRQIEDLMLLSFVIGAVVAALTQVWWHGLIVWWSGGAWQLPNFVAAWLRGWDVYRDTEHERSAYSRTDVIMQRHVGTTWEQVRREKREHGRT